VQWSIKPFAKVEKLLAWRSLVPPCIHALCGWLTARWHYLSTISLIYSISSSGVELYSGTFSSWYMEQWIHTYQQLPIKFSSKPVHQPRLTGSSHSWCCYPHSSHILFTRPYKCVSFPCIIR